MDRWLIVGQQDPAYLAALERMAAGAEIVALPLDDAFTALREGEPPALVWVDLVQRIPLAPALVAVARSLRTDCRIVVTFIPEQRSAASAALRAGADALLPRPFELEELAACAGRARPVERRDGKDVQDAAACRPEIADLDALSLFVRGLAHEINNPLTTIRGLLQVLMHSGATPAPRGAPPAETTRTALPPDALDALRTMEAETLRISEVVQELEFFSGHRRPVRTAVDAANLLAAEMKAAGLAGQPARIDPSAVHVLADREQLALALRHLLGYLKTVAVAADPRWQIELTRRGGRLVFEVGARCETVSRTPPERLLIPLYVGRGGDPQKRSSLASVFGIARAHGGALHARRDGADRLVFRLELPVGTLG